MEKRLRGKQGRHWTDEQRARMRASIAKRGSPRSAGRYVMTTEGLEHRLVAERALGRPLRGGEVVHHIDLNKKNNANNNLVVCTPWLHGYMHQRMQQLWVKEHILAVE